MLKQSMSSSMASIYTPYAAVFDVEGVRLFSTLDRGVTLATKKAHRISERDQVVLENFRSLTGYRGELSVIRENSFGEGLFDSQALFLNLLTLTEVLPLPVEGLTPEDLGLVKEIEPKLFEPQKKGGTYMLDNVRKREFRQTGFRIIAYRDKGVVRVAPTNLDRLARDVCHLVKEFGPESVKVYGLSEQGTEVFTR
ncbi:MAG: hypothetical protein QW767_06150 [Thermoprotei archaeon]